MKKQTIVIIILIVIIIILAIFIYKDKIGNVFGGENIEIEKNKFKGLEKRLEEINKDAEFYRYWDIYSSLLDDKEYKEVIETAENYVEENEEEYMNLIVTIIMSELFKDERTKELITGLKDDVYKNRELTKEEEGEMFEKNNSCANLVSTISEQLSKKYNNTSSKITEKEEYNFVFYSPKMKTCLYSSTYTYSNLSPYYSRSSYIVYNASTGIEIEEYRTYYSYDYPDISEEKVDNEIKQNRKDYSKFILENSNYNIELLKDLSSF